MKILILLLILTLPLNAVDKFTVFKGLPFRKTFQLYQDENLSTPVDITGWTFALKFRRPKGGDVLGSCTFTITDAVNGKVQADLTSEDTEAMAEGSAQWALIGRDAAGFDHYILNGSGAVLVPISTID